MNRALRNGVLTALLFLFYGMPAFAQTTLSSFNSTWKYLDNGTDQGTAWRATAFADGTWASGPGRFGFGDPGMSTCIKPGANLTSSGTNCTVAGTGTTKYITTYFRRTVNIANISSFDSIRFNLVRDDGAVIYVNGTEVARQNMPTTTITYTTGAAANVGGAAETTIYPSTVSCFTPTSPFKNGANVIAVEVHQDLNTSSDLAFDLEMIGLPFATPGGSTEIFPYTDTWKYLDNGTDQGTGWTGAAFNDAAWASGAGELGYGDGDEATVLSFGSNANAKYATTYFRKSINLPNPALYSTYTFKVKRDDGMIFYLNGAEIYRSNISPATGPIAYNAYTGTTLAVDGANELDSIVNIPAAMFLTGANQLAVEIHQQANNSSDISWRCRMLGNPSAPVIPVTLLRGPYLQAGSGTAMTVRWRTNVASKTKLEVGTTLGTYPMVVSDNKDTTEHVIRITGLTPDTRYFYRIGTEAAALQGTAANFFTTAPTDTTTRKVTFAAFGDCGRNDNGFQSGTLSAYQSFLTANGLGAADVLMLLGDNAYNGGYQSEFQTSFFNVYSSNILKNHVLFPAPGNHDYDNLATLQATHIVPYYDIFSLPAAGESGGVPSGNPAYYSYDWGNVHILSLDSYGEENAGTTRLYDTLGTQVQWIKADLAANTKKWTVAYWHHPPYTMGSHNSDNEGELVSMRQNFIRILERNGVDMVVCGHSHDYERSYLLKGHYGNEASFNKAAHTADSSSAKYNGSVKSCPYNVPSGKVNHGTVYVVAGSAGADGGVQTGYPHNALPFSIDDGGMFFFEVQGNRLNAKFIRRTGAIDDQFTIMKDVNKKDSINIAPGTPVMLTASYTGAYNWDNGNTAKTQTVTPTTDSVVYVKDSLNSICLVDTFILHTGVAAPVIPHEAFKFNGTSQYATFGTAAGLGAANFTLETWIKKTGTGITTSTGTGGVTATPLITKGRAESDGSNLDMNYFLGITAGGNLCADFEEGTGQPSPGLNHPVTGATVLQNNVWYHVAATYDGTDWNLYINGNLELNSTVARLPQSASIQHAALGTAMTSTGVPAGYFAGVMDEARIWNYARTMQQIRDSINAQINSNPAGLTGRWAMNDSTGVTLAGTGSSGINGTRVNAPLSVAGAPFNLTYAPPNLQPNPPTAYQPADSANGVNSNSLSLNVTDPEGSPMTVTFMGRERSAAVDSPTFTIIPIPDVQFYTGALNGGTNAIFKAQTQWIKDSLAAKNIVYAIQLGDCVQNGDNGGDPIEWKRADTAFKIIENLGISSLPDGLPYGICIGNHDQSPAGATGTTTFYNQYFGSSRFAGRSYYGGNYGSNNDNHFDLFSASGMDFLSVSLEYDPAVDTLPIRWADSLLKAYPARRAIISSHWLINSDGSWSAQGLAIYDRLKANRNLDLMLCGHVNPNGEAMRSDTYLGHTTHTMLSDYQDRTNGGNGWMRIMTFNPAADQISVKTYSPTLGQFETDANSQFNLSYNMSGVFDTVGMVANVASGSNARVTWAGLQNNKSYEWYAIVSDGQSTVTSPVNEFHTGASPLPIAYIKLSAAAKNKAVELDWEVAGEFNCESFTIERSADAAHYADLKTVASKGNHNDPLIYSSGDAAPQAGRSYYRIRQKEAGGTMNYSNTATVNNGGFLNSVEVYPSPNDGRNIMLSSAVKTAAEVRIDDAAGRTFYMGNLALGAPVQVPVRLLPGTYFITIQAGGDKQVRKLLVR